jgi:AcrR family transcriptional regulator
VVSADGLDLPSGLAQTWGLRRQRRLGPKPSMTIEQITAAAIAAADADGLAGLSMGSVAARLGCTKMALYRYVDAKEDLQALMLDAVVGPPPPPDPAGTDWRAAVEFWAESLLARFQAHPWAADLPVGSALMTRNQTWWLEAALRALRPSGLTLPERLSVTLLLSSHVIATARMQRDRRTLEAALTGEGSFDPGEAFAALAAAPGADGLEEVPAAFAAGHLQDPDGEREEFVLGVTCILDGAQAVLTRRAARSPAALAD